MHRPPPRSTLFPYTTLFRSSPLSNARLERRNASSSGEKIRTATVPGQTLERGQGRNQVAASIKEQNCDRQINKIHRDKMVAYLSSFYGTVNNYLRPYGQVGELLRMLRSLRRSVVPGWRRLIVAEPVFNGAIEQRSNEADSTRVSSRNFVMQPTRVTTPRPVITNPSTPQRTNL